jgi:hypothetical protein
MFYLQIVFLEFFEALIECAQVYITDSALAAIETLQAATFKKDPIANESSSRRASVRFCILFFFF